MVRGVSIGVKILHGGVRIGVKSSSRGPLCVEFLLLSLLLWIAISQLDYILLLEIL